MSSVVAFKKVTHRFSQDAGVSDMSLRIEAGETVALIGPSASGKSTLLKLAAGLLWPQGSVLVVVTNSHLRTPWPSAIA